MVRSVTTAHLAGRWADPLGPGRADAVLAARVVCSVHGHHRRRGDGHVLRAVGRHQRSGCAHVGSGRCRLRRLRNVRDHCHLCVRAAGQLDHRRLSASRRSGGSRGLRAVSDGGHRRRGHDVGQRSDRAVPGPGGAVDLAVRVGGQPSASHREPGKRHQVLRPRRLLVGLLPVRHRPHLRRHRFHQPRRHLPVVQLVGRH